MMDISNSVDINSINQKKYENINTENLKDDKLKAVCDDFEAFFLKQMMDVSLKSSTIAGEEAGSDIIKGMYTESISNQAAGGMGISNILYEFLTRNNK